MSEPIRDVHAERVRDFYRNQGKAMEQERIIELLQTIADRKLTSTSHLVFEGLISLIKGEN